MTEKTKYDFYILYGIIIFLIIAILYLSLNTHEANLEKNKISDKLETQAILLNKKIDSLKKLKTPDTVFTSGTYRQGFKDGFDEGVNEGYNQGVEDEINGVNDPIIENDE